MRLRAVAPEQLDVAEAGQWTLRQIAFHLEESNYYADAVGSL